MTEPLAGVLPVFQTPFRDDDSIDFDALRSEIDWIAAQGADGVVFGMVSETLRLADAERREVISAAVTAAARSNLPCIASIGAESTNLALRRLADAVDVGATALMATPPLTGRHDERELHEYFRAILRRSPLPVVIQDASGYVGQTLSIGVQAELFYEFGSRVGFKPESVPLKHTLSALRAATGGGAAIYEGMGGAALLETFPAGVTGTMPGAEVCWAVVAMWNALKAGDTIRAQSIHAPLAQMIAMQSDLDSFVVCEKFLLAQQGVLMGTRARGPLGFELRPDDERRLGELLQQLRQNVDAPAADPPAVMAQPSGQKTWR